MNEEELSAIEQRAQAATPGPWRADIGTPDDHDIVVWGPTREQLVSNVGCDRYSENENETAVCFDGEAKDAAFIAAAREDVPALIAEVRRLKAIIGLVAKSQREPWDEALFNEACEAVENAV